MGFFDTFQCSHSRESITGGSESVFFSRGILAITERTALKMTHDQKRVAGEEKEAGGGGARGAAPRAHHTQDMSTGASHMASFKVFVWHDQEDVLIQGGVFLEAVEGPEVHQWMWNKAENSRRPRSTFSLRRNFPLPSF